VRVDHLPQSRNELVDGLPFLFDRKTTNNRANQLISYRFEKVMLEKNNKEHFIAQNAYRRIAEGGMRIKESLVDLPEKSRNSFSFPGKIRSHKNFLQRQRKSICTDLFFFLTLHGIQSFLVVI
jgi:hypothetical protein